MKREDNKVVFFADDHSYWKGDSRLKSVGSVLKRIFPKFDENYWLTHIVLKGYFGDEYMEMYRKFPEFMPPACELFPQFLRKIPPETFRKHKQSLRMQWDRKRNESNLNGHRFHDKREDLVREYGGLVNPWTGDWYKHGNPTPTVYDNESISLDLSELSDGVYTELLVFDLDLMIAGQADVVFIETIGDIRYVDIYDYKTNEKKPQMSGPVRFKDGPFEGRYISTGFKYTLQLNCYAYLLMHHGFTPRNMAIAHFKNYDLKNKSHMDVESFFNDIQSIAIMQDIFDEQSVFFDERI